MRQEQTSIANDIDSVRESIALDRQIKVVLSNKVILSRILARTMQEFKDMDYRQVASCIEGEPEIGKIAVEPGRTNMEKVSGSATESSIPNEGTIYFDIRLYVKIPNGLHEPVKILLNLEAQKNFYPGYDIVTRAIFYCARMLSAELNTEFSVASTDKLKYNNIKKVVSIWICLDASKGAENSITRYYIDHENLVGKGIRARYDLMSVVIICLSKDKSAKSDDMLLSMLSILLDENLEAVEKKSILEREYGIPMTVQLEKEVRSMGNIGEYYIENAIKRGLEKGMQEGLEKGLEKERRSSIERMLKNGKSPEEIAEFCGYELSEVTEIQHRLLQMV